ncbi:MAG TPA: polyribonucleotide nucleotidyltransferase [Sedimentisphaerales bacterium]|nr:polyribonucleotide nucleotidyltransferase [Sedimentisphaerales bacterium]
MFEVTKVEGSIGGRKLSIETGKIARQADGAVVVQYGETMVLVTVVTCASKTDDIDYFPLSVDYREKLSAAGKFPGGFMKREGRPTTKEVLTARQIDRPIRPLFPEGYFQEVQIMAQVLSFDGENDPDVLAMIGASAALAISKIPFIGPIGACRLARLDGKFVINPAIEQLDKADLNLLLGGRKEAINMIEVESKQIKESVIADAIAAAHEVVGQVCDLITELQEKVGVEKELIIREIDPELTANIEAQVTDKLYELKKITDKKQRNEAVNALFDGVIEQYCKGKEAAAKVYGVTEVKTILDKIQGKVVKKMLLQGIRSDGRAFDEVRPIECEVGALPRSHGSALFTRGQTQALVTVTLGTGRDSQIVDGLVDEYSENFMLHYNFPPYAVGEVKPVRGPGRREIGHGALAEKALKQVKPEAADFPYTIKINSDITESNGSSSMASVCGGCLAMMDAGVPIIKPVAGISIGMISDEKGYKLLTDIAGEEDHYGEMDFKVAGTVDGITAIQLDIKAEGLAHDAMVEALEQARKTRVKILDIMTSVIAEPKPNLSVYAPKVTSIKIDPELIGKVIGPGGKMIKSIQEKTGAVVEIEEDGTISISCVGGNGHLEARDIIESMTTPPKVGKVYKDCKVVSVKDFGIFVEIAPGLEGLCHVSELSHNYVKNIEDVCKVGDLVDVKLILIDDQGRLKLSRKAAMPKPEKDNAKDNKED